MFWTRIAMLGGASCVLTAALLDLLTAYAERLGLQRTNFEDRLVVGSLGIALWLTVTLEFLAVAALDPGQRMAAGALAQMSVIAGTLGLLDDLFGSRSVGGFRGHFGELFRGRLTTGAAKALLLPACSFAIASLQLRQCLPGALLTAGLVSCFGNTINLIDVRPGRAVAAWFSGALVGALLAGIALEKTWPLALMLGPLLVYLPADTGRRGMMGDVGANLIGALLGLQIAIWAPVPAKLILLALLIGVQLYSESHSLGREIEERWWLRWLDAPARWRRP